MIKRNKKALLVLPIVAMTMAACGSDKAATTASTVAPAGTTAGTTADTTAATSAGTTAATSAGTTAGTTADTTAATSAGTTAGTTAGTAAAGGAVSLKGLCPDTVIIQTDWNPEGEHGFLYQLVGDKPTIDTKAVSVTGPLVAGGKDTGVKIQIRSGGPAVGFKSDTETMYTDPEILLGFVYTDEAIQNSAKFPTVAIESGFEKNPQMIMWDPNTYPDVKSIADLGKKKILVRYFKGAAWLDYYTSKGILSKDQVDGSYDGTPASFIADQGKSAQQGFGSAEPYQYETEIKDWGKKVAYSYINDAGWNNYAESIATKPENITKYGDCFKKLVPMIQQSSVDYLNSPAKANALIVDAVTKFNNGWIYSAGLADYSVATMKKDGLMANGTDGVMGSFDIKRVDDLIALATPVYTSGGQAPKAGLKASDFVTNEFLDTSIHL